MATFRWETRDERRERGGAPAILPFADFAFGDEGDAVFVIREFRGFVGLQFFNQMVRNANNHYVLYKLVFFQDFLNPASATQNVAEAGRLHVGVVVEDYERERLGNTVGPEFAHVVVVAVVKKVDFGGGAFDFRSVLGRAGAFVHQFLDFFNGAVVAVAVGASDLGAVQPAHLVVCIAFCCQIVQCFHERLLKIDVTEILYSDEHYKKIGYFGVFKDLENQDEMFFYLYIVVCWKKRM